MHALEYFSTHLKYEKNPRSKEAITTKVRLTRFRGLAQFASHHSADAVQGVPRTGRGAKGPAEWAAACDCNTSSWCCSTESTGASRKAKWRRWGRGWRRRTSDHSHMFMLLFMYSGLSQFSTFYTLFTGVLRKWCLNCLSSSGGPNANDAPLLPMQWVFTLLCCAVR